MSRRTTSPLRPRLELLEGRSLPTLFMVTSNLIDFNVDGQVTLLEAIQAANSNVPSGDAPAGSAGLDTIQFAPSLNGQTITKPVSTLHITEALTINGPGSGLLTISGNNVAQIFDVYPAVDVVIRGLTLTQGAGTGGAIVNQGNLTLTDSFLTACKSGTSGGGIYNFGNLTLNNCLLSGNTSTVYGGGVYSLGTLTVNNSNFSANSAPHGGGIMSQGPTSLSGNTFVGNTATMAGGAVYLGNATVKSCAFTGNSAPGGGGLENFGNTTVTNSTFSGNSANGGGGIENQGTLTVANSTITGNAGASVGGGIRNISGGPVVLTSTIVAGNSSRTAPNSRARLHWTTL